MNMTVSIEAKRLSFGKVPLRFLIAGACVAWPLAVRPQTPPPGGLDAAFTPQADNTIYAVAVQPGGRILLGGNFTKINNTTSHCLARLTSDGTLDPGFFAGPGADNTVRTLTVQADGRILVGGDFSSINGMNWSRVARLNADGSVDSTFDQLIGANSRVYAVAPYDSQVLLGGDFTKVNGVTRNYLARLNANGSLDPDFNPSFNGTIYTVTVLADKRVLAGGDFTSVNNQPVKYLARLNPNGSLDPGFNVTLDSTVFTVGLQSDGKAVLGGYFGRVNNAYHSGLARLNTDGTLDDLFTAGSSGTIYSLAIQADDKVLLGGRFTTINSATRNNIARLNANGLLDATFDAAQGPDYSVRALAVQGDGKVLLGGEFSTVNAIDHNYLARLNGTAPPPVGTDVSVMIWRAVEIGWNSETNGTYQVQWASEVDTNTWYDLGAVVVGNGLINSIFDTTRESVRRFYRVRKQ